jgi:hypothetical protein
MTRPALIALLSIACSGNRTVNDGGWTGSAVPFDKLASTYSQSVCWLLTRCFVYRDYCSLSHCEADEPPFGIDLLMAELDAGWTRYDESAAGDCAAKFIAASCDDIHGVSLGVFGLLGQCPNVLVGQQPDGAPCISRFDCKAGSGCLEENSVCPGVCRPYPRVGESCTSFGYCSDGAYCIKGVCRPAPAIGDACDAGDDCYPYLWCNRDAGSCRGYADAGEPCDLGGVNGAPCFFPYWCNGTCQPRSSSGGSCHDDWNCVNGLSCLPGPICELPGDAGAACDSDFDCAGEHVYCRHDAGACAPLPGRGEPCAPRDFPFQLLVPSCAPGLICSGGLCKDRGCPGDTCGATAGCTEGLCDAGTCTSRSAIGKPCSVDDDCATKFCDHGACKDPISCSP